MNQQPIIPPKLNKNVLKIKGEMTIWDFVSLLVFGGLSALVGWSLTPLGWMFQSLVAIFMMMVLGAFLLPIKTKRVYTYVYLWFKFIFSNKKFKQKGFNNTKLLIPYQKIVEDFIYTGKEYFGALRIEGFNLINLSIEEQNIYIEKLRQLFKSIETPMSLVKTDEPLHFINNKQFIKNKLKDIEKNQNLNQIQKQSRTKQIKSYLKNFNDQGILSANQLEKNYYLIIYANSIKELKKWLHAAQDKIQNARLIAKSLNRYQLVNLLHYLLNPYFLDLTKKAIDAHQNNLGELLSFKNIKFRADCIINNQNFFYHIQTIASLPIFPHRAWALPLMDSDGSVIININPLKKSALKHQLARSVTNLATNMLTTSKRDFVGKKEQEHKLQIYQELIEQIGYGIEIFKNVDIFVIHYGQTKRELLNKQNFFNNILKDNDMKNDRLIFEQLEAYSAFLPKKSSPFDKRFSVEMPTLALAESFPFITNNLKDERGLYLGENLIGEPIVLDQFKPVHEDRSRKNHNMIIIGQTGSGKTWLVIKILNFHLMMNRQVIVIDPEREYKKLCEYYGGIWIDIGNGLKSKINPLQILGNFLEDDNQLSKQALIANHVQFLENWLEILFPDLQGNVLRYFSQMLGKLYNQFFKTQDEILNLKNEQYPTFDDFYNFLQNNPSSKKEYEVIVELIANEFIGLGKYHNLYNGHSTISTTTNNPLFVFDINTLYEKGHRPTINAQLYLLTSFISHKVRDNSLNEKKQLIICIDEAYLLIDEQKPIALDFIFQMTKRIRKRFGGMILVTQNPHDFLGSEAVLKKTKAIINNVQYSFIMSLSPEDLKDVHEMYKTFGGLSEPQRNFIAHAKNGQGLLINGGFERHEVTIKISEAEKEVFQERKNND